MLLSIENLTVTYPGEHEAITALRNVSLEVHEGEIVGILGESGSGKTTLGLAILGLLGPRVKTQGTIRICGAGMTGKSEAAWRKVRGSAVSAVFQDPRPTLNPLMRVSSQIDEVIRVHAGGSRTIRNGEAARLLRLAGVADTRRLLRAWPHELSGGECQRVAIAQALACRARLLVADEPTASLDTVTQLHILDTLAELVRNEVRSLILISHNPAVLARLAGRVLVLQRGEVVEAGPANQILRFPAAAYTRTLVQHAG